MGVHNLWDLLTPVGKPIKVETLRNKRLAIDASIWIYQFMIALKGQRNPHIWGFFKRICKLLYFGIKPIFVFDGKVAELKRDTIKKRKLKGSQNSDNHDEDIKNIAKRILSKKLQQHAEISLERSSPQKRKRKRLNTERKEHSNVNGMFDHYYDDFYNDNEEEDQNDEAAHIDKKRDVNESLLFKKQDDYDLPNIKVDINPQDQRFQMDNEYDKLTKEVAIDINQINLDEIDPQSKDFSKLPLSTQYIVLSHLRLKSRLRMGYTKSQLQNLFPNPMEFSKFQISMVQKRNYLTQKLMNVSGMNSDDISSGRLAGDKNRLYQLQRINNGYSLTLTEKSTDLEKQVRKEFDDEGLDAADEYDIDWNEHVDSAIEIPTDSVTQQDGLFVSGDDNVKSNPQTGIDRKHSDEEDDEDFEDVEFEDVDQVDEKDKLQKEIESLYEYAKNNNIQQNEGEKNDEALENQIEWLQELELKKAIEESKKDLINLLNKEQGGNPQSNDNVKEPPIILSQKTLSMTLLKNLDFSKNTLFQSKEKETPDDKPRVLDNGKKEEKVTEVATNTENENEKDDENPKLLPLPDWFQSSTIGNWKGAIDRKDSDEEEEEEEEEDEIPKKYNELEVKLNLDETNVMKRDLSVSNNIESEKGLSLPLPDIIEIKDEDHQSSIVQPPKNEQSKSQLPSSPINGGSPIATSDVELVDDNPSVNPIPKLDLDLNDEEAPSVDQIENLDSSQNADDNSIPSPFDVYPNGEKPKTPPPALSPDLTTVNIDSDDSFSDDDINEVNIVNDAYFIDIPTEFPELNSSSKPQTFTSDDITQEMIQDIHTLLSIMGIPYLTSPEEAEAQCAELENLGLCDGIITDDSDCFLFGGVSIYKNMFMNKQFTEKYHVKDIEIGMGLTRSSMIDLAVLLGSDYTLGVKGVGKVMAMEILGEFGDLERFKDWWLEYQNGVIDESKENSVRKSIRNKLKNHFYIHDNDFPPKKVFKAYVSPVVDKDETEFKWGVVNVDQLVEFMNHSQGWNQNETRNIIDPVIANMMKPPQRSIDDYMQVGVKTKISKFSKRLQHSIKKLLDYRERTSLEQILGPEEWD